MNTELLIHIAKRLGIAIAAYFSLWLVTFGNPNGVGFLVTCCLIGAIDIGMWVDNNMPKYKI